MLVLTCTTDCVAKHNRLEAPPMDPDVPWSPLSSNGSIAENWNSKLESFPDGNVAGFVLFRGLLERPFKVL